MTDHSFALCVCNVHFNSDNEIGLPSIKSLGSIFPQFTVLGIDSLWHSILSSVLFIARYAPDTNMFICLLICLSMEERLPRPFSVPGYFNGLTVDNVLIGFSINVIFISLRSMSKTLYS